MSLKIEDAQFESMWRNSGLTADGSRIEMSDALALPNTAAMLPKVMSGMVREAQEPLLVGTSLLQRINYTAGIAITMPAIGAIVADDMAEEDEYPEGSPQTGGTTSQVTIGKVGTSFKVTQEMVRYNQFDMIGAMLRAAGRALARLKEQKIFNMIRNMGVRVFDNLQPSSSMYGVTHGRDLSGAANGTLVADDIFDAWAHMMMSGYFADTIILHPLAWPMFIKDATLRAFMLQNGGGTIFGTYTGNARSSFPSGVPQGPSSGQDIVPGGTTSGLTPTSTAGYFPNALNSAPVLPGYMNIPLRIIVSPFMPFNAQRRLTDIFLCSSADLGALIVDEDVTVEEWVNPANDIKKVKMRERYAVALFEQGKGACVMRNVKVGANEVVLPAQATLPVDTSNLAVIAPGTPLSL